MRELSYLDLEEAAASVMDAKRVADLLALSAEYGDAAETNLLPGIRHTAEMLAERLSDLARRIDELSSAWLAERR